MLDKNDLVEMNVRDFITLLESKGWVVTNVLDSCEVGFNITLNHEEIGTRFIPSFSTISKRLQRVLFTDDYHKYA